MSEKRVSRASKSERVRGELKAESVRGGGVLRKSERKEAESERRRRSEEQEGEHHRGKARTQRSVSLY